MGKISLRIADLRKKRHMTQQELADNIGVSFQTISKWETGISMPDITVLPALADFFSVSTDQLLGLKPLDEETYFPEKTATKDFWNNKLEYLLRTRKSYCNNDYAGFLVSQVWKIDKPVSILDCGCGYGFLGLLLLPHLPEGSSYTGIDFAEDLISKGRTLFAQQGHDATFICKNIFEYSAENRYDLVVCQAVLRHLDDPAAFIQKMIRFAKPNGYVVCIDANREFECCGLYIDGMDYQALCEHAGLEKKLTLLLDMYGVIVKESKGYFIPYTFEHFDKKEYGRLTKAFREDCLFTKAGNGDINSDEFLSLLGYPDPIKTMQDYLNNYLTFDKDFLWFAEKNYKRYDFVLLSNDVKEWSSYLFDLYGLHKYFKECIVSGDIHMRKPESRIFSMPSNAYNVTRMNVFLLITALKTWRRRTKASE